MDLHGYDSCGAHRDAVVVEWNPSAQQRCKHSCNFLDLPEITDALGAFSDPNLLARLALTSRSMCFPILSAEYIAQVANNLRKAGMEWADGCQSLEELSLGFAVEKISSSDSANHIYFPYGGGLQVRDETRPFLLGAASLCGRYPNLRIHIDAHTGAGAPSGIATSTSARRCESVIQELVQLGMNSAKVTSTAWGKRISSVWDEPEDDRAARAELFFSIGTKEFPKRKDYYDLVPENKKPAQQSERTGADELSSGDSENEGNPLQRMAQRDMLRLLQIFGRHGGIRFIRQPAAANDLGDSSDSDGDAEEHEDLTPLLAED